MNVYLRAAQLVASQTCHESCIAIGLASGGSKWGERTGKLIACAAAAKYSAIFRPKKPQLSECWLSCQFSFFADAREWRLTALCFAAAMHDTGDL